tara:strand:+ start:152 stop:814 length:663 start_codon:yes stop_codon:yes gene_type:complete
MKDKIKKLDLDIILTELAVKRPVFQNEGDFQFELAWKIKTKFPNWRIRFEKNLTDLDNDKRRMDLWIEGDNTYALELKYPTRTLSHEVNNEIFKLRNHSAEDYSRYAFLNDIQRMEEVVSNNTDVKGYAILITNNMSIGVPPTKDDVADFQFRIHEGRIINNEKLDWIRKEGGQSYGQMENPIKLRGTYKFNWKDYSELKNKNNLPVTNGKFRYLFVEIY